MGNFWPTLNPGFLHEMKHFVLNILKKRFLHLVESL